MPNTITAVLPSIFAGLRELSREMVGIIPAVQVDADVSRAAVGQSVTVPIVPAATGGNITPGATPPDDGDAVITSMSVSITKSKYSPVRWNGEEQLAVGPGGQFNRILAQQFQEALRWLVNQMEVDLIVTGYQNSSRAYGIAGTAPFGTAGDLTDFAGVNRILDENGAPMAGRRMVIGSAARFNLEGKQNVLFKVNEAGTDALLRNRILANVMGFDLGVSAGVGIFTKGTGAAYTTSAAGFAIGVTSIPIITGTGTVLAGDVVTFAGDTNKYVVKTGVAAPGTIVLNAPGLMQAIPAAATAMAIGANYAPNLAFGPNALLLAARAPALPEGGDMAADRETITDPVSGLSFEVSLYREYRRIRYEVAMAWGVGAPNPSQIATLLG